MRRCKTESINRRVNHFCFYEMPNTCTHVCTLLYILYSITVVKHIPTTTVILITCVVGISLLMIKKNGIPYRHKRPKYGKPDGCWYFIINSEIQTTHVINAVVVGIWFTAVKYNLKI